MKKLLFTLAVLALLISPTAVLAKGGGAETGHFTWSEFYWVESYEGWGPACYYGQTVRVVYNATNSWTYVLKGEDVRETLVQNGTATIYNMSGGLLDKQPFHVTERFYDAGTDVALRHDYGTSVWYQASHDWWNANLEEYHYIWKIPGVYDWCAWNRGGEWAYGWNSGGCRGNYADGWPPRPPHPFNK